MAVEPMVRVRLFAHREEIARVAAAMQDLGCFHPLRRESVETEPGAGRGPERAARAAAFLSAGESRGMLDQLFRPRRQVTDGEIERASSPDVASVVERLLETERAAAELRHRREAILGTRALVLPWVGLTISHRELDSLASVSHRAVRIPPGGRRALEGRLRESDLPLVALPLATHEGRESLVLLAPRPRERELDPLLDGLDAEPVDLAFLSDPPDALLEGLERALADVDRGLADLEEMRRGMTAERPSVELLHDLEEAAATRQGVVAAGVRTETIVCLEGWVPRSEHPTFVRTLEEGFPSLVLQVVPAGDEVPPVRLRNSRAVRPFEIVTELYGRPNPVELDPTPLLAPYFIVFFGLCITDAAYGIVLALLAWLLLRWGRRRGADVRFPKLMIYGGISTLILGAITGGWLGDIQNRLPEALAPVGRMLNALVVFSPLDQPMTFMILSLALGFLQIMTGLAVKVLGLLHSGSTAEALLGALPWFTLLPSLILWGSAGFLPALGPAVPACKLLAAASAATIVLYGGPGIRNPLARVGAGLYALYGISAYVGDLLSYLRLVALGLSTGVIGMVINLLAGMLAGLGLIGWLPAAALLVAGHLFNLAINLLGAYVHSSRLQYVEFFPKFLAGGGVPFAPLAFNGRFTIKRAVAEGGS